MSTAKRVVRRIEPGKIVSFDDQLWPINSALLVLAAFVVGTLIAISRFDDTRLLYNGYVRLAAVAATTGLLIFGAVHIDSRKLRRALQFAAVLSLLAHVVLMVVLFNHGMAMRRESEDSSELVLAPEEEPVVLPDYALRTPEDPQPSFERPVETDAEATTDADVSRQESDLEVSQPSPTATPGVAQQIAPSALAVGERELTAPRQASQPSRLSRQLVDVPTPAPEQAQSVVADAAPAEPTELAQARVNPVERTESASSFTRPTDVPEPAEIPAPSAPELPRREASTSLPEASAAMAALPRQLAEPPAAAAETAEPAAMPESNLTREAAAPAPAVGELARSATTPESSASAGLTNPTATAEPTSVAGGSLRRAETGGLADVPAAAISATSPARAVRPAAAEASPVNIESPALGQSTEAARPEVAPGRMALSRGAAGSVGGGDQVTVERGVGSTDPAAAVASGSAPRRVATQNLPDGSAAVPSLPALTPRAVAGAESPSAVLAADDVAAPTATGSQTPGDIEAPASAAIVRASATAPQGEITAGAGAAAIDTGEPRTVMPERSGRTSGGGAPVVRSSIQEGTMPRAVRGGAPLAAIGATNVADVPAAPVPEGGGAAGTGSPSAATSAGVARAAQSALPAQDNDVPPAPAGQAAVGEGAIGSVAGTTIGRAATRGEAPPASAPAATPGRAPRAVASIGAGEAQVPVDDAPAASQGSAAQASAVADARGTAPSRAAATLPADASESAGAATGAATNTASIVPSNQRRAAASAGESPQSTAPGAPQTPLRRAVAGVPGGTSGAVDAPEMEAAPSGGTQSSPAEISARGEVAGPVRAGGAIPVQVAATDGLGGLGATLSPQVGSLSRRAQPDSPIVHPGAARFPSPRTGGPAAISGLAREPAEAFSRRSSRRFDRRTGSGNPTERTDEAVELGLVFLSRHQADDGNWSLHNYSAGREGYPADESVVFRSDTAATGLALLAFLGGGYDHYDEQYKKEVRGGLDWLMKNQKPDGDLYVPADSYSNASAHFYSHGIAAIALCEAFGMTGDAELGRHAQKAIDFIVASQHKSLGAWRYEPGKSSDTSVAGWQLMALKSGELAGLAIPAETYDLVRKWLDSAQVTEDDAPRYVYNPFAENRPETRAGLRPNPTMTSVGLLMRFYLGWNRDDARMAKGADYLLANPPAIGTRQNPLRDTYYWYYATQVMFHMKGEHWRQWQERLEPLLVERQIQTGPLAGSWDPRGAVADRWGPQAGRIYVTTMNLLSLEVSYRHLPIYESTAK